MKLTLVVMDLGMGRLQLHLWMGALRVFQMSVSLLYREYEKGEYLMYNTATYFALAQY